MAIIQSLIGIFSILAAALFIYLVHRRYKRIVAHYSSTFELLAEGVVLLRPSLQIVWLNKAAAQFLSYPRRRLIKKTIDSEALLQKQPILKKCRELCFLALRHKQVVSEVLTDLPGENKQLEVIICPTNKGELVLLLKSNTKEKKSSDLSRDFIANASHELRTPITIIKGFAETLDEITDLSPEMVKEIVGKIIRNCDRMESLVKNLLLLTDLDNLSECKLHPCDLEGIVNFCRSQIRDLHPEVEVKVVLEGKPEKVTVDKELLELALFNLLKNAVKYSPSPALIEIKVQFTLEEVKISITDQGIGIKNEDLPHIFERFYRVDKARSRKLGGAGLGLSIVKNIIEKHEGNIAVTSEFGVGTTFEISLPYQQGNIYA